MNRISEVILSVFALLVVSIIIVNIDDQTTSKTNTESPDQEDFYTMTENPPLADLLMPDTLDDVIVGTDLIIIGEVISIDESEMDTPQMIVNRINILETIDGNSESKTIELFQSHIFRGYEPSLQPGDQLVLFLHKQETTDGYVAVHPYASYFYIDTQQAIHPVYLTDDFTTYSNIQLKNFKKAIHRTDD